MVSEYGLKYIMIPINWIDFQTKKLENKQFKQLYCYIFEKGTYRLTLKAVGTKGVVTHMPIKIVKKDKKIRYFDVYIPHDGDFLLKGMMREEGNNKKWQILWEFRISCFKTKYLLYHPNYLAPYYDIEAQMILPKSRIIPARKTITFKVSMKNITWPIVSQKHNTQVVMYPSKGMKDTYEAEYNCNPGKVVISYCTDYEYMKHKAIEFDAIENMQSLNYIEPNLLKYHDMAATRIVQSCENQRASYSHREEFIEVLDRLWKDHTHNKQLLKDLTVFEDIKMIVSAIEKIA